MKQVYEYLFPEEIENRKKRKENSNKNIIKISKPIKLTNRPSNNKYIKSFSIMDNPKSLVPNKLIKYFNEKATNKIYIYKLSVLLNSNDKKYKIKRPIINDLHPDFKENNQEYLTKMKFFSPKANDSNKVEDNDINSINIIPLKNNNSSRNTKFPQLKLKGSYSEVSKLNLNNISKNFEKEGQGTLEENFEYYRTPQVIRNNERIMLNYLKRKNRLFHNMPYLGRNRNDLMIFEYNKKNNSLSNLNNNLLIPQNKKIFIKKINLNFNKRREYDNQKVSSCPSNISDKNEFKIKKNILPNIKNGSKSMILQNNNKNINDKIIKDNSNKSIFENKIGKNNISIKYNKLQNLSSKKLVKFSVNKK